ncbi:MAG: helix-turn-helix domain-containing protein [Deltaproteobacteria bacterium]|nr:helix-turn-helix domain-containing protein [Deltaproteobacteria bacterium]
MGNPIGSRLKIARQRAGLNMRDLGEKAGVSAQAISKYERGINVPGSDVLLRLSKALDVKVEYFFRTTSITSFDPVYRKKSRLKFKDERAITAEIQDWLERYLEIETLYDLDELYALLKKQRIANEEDLEEAAIYLRKKWSLGLAPVENLIEILEMNGIKVGRIKGHSDFDSCTFIMDDARPVIVVKKDMPGDRQRFSLAHELGHLILDLPESMNSEKAANRFAGAFLVPKDIVYAELGKKRKSLNPFELHLLKHKYGLSMQGWIHRAEDLSVIPKTSAKRVFEQFRREGWHLKEPGDQIIPEKPDRMTRLIVRALEENVISASKASELLGKSLDAFYEHESKRHGKFPVDIRN